MRATILFRALALVSLFASAPLATPLASQDDEGRRPTTRIAAPDDLARAEALLAEARLYEVTPPYRSGWLDAARLYTASAALRPVGDEEVFRSLRRAAEMLYALGRYAGAQRTLEQAASHARLYGNIQREAEALLGAAWVAGRRGDVDATNRHLSRTYLLTYAPLLPEDVRQDIRRRVLLPAAALFAARAVAP
jgi:tetratricopeptide (TPR) repeat protein